MGIDMEVRRRLGRIDGEPAIGRGNDPACRPQEPQDDGLDAPQVITIAETGLENRAHTEVDVPGFVTRNRGESRVEPGENAHFADDAEQELLPGESEHSLDD